MDKQKKPLIVANWKLHGGESFSLRWLTAFKNQGPLLSSAEVVICPPFTDLASLFMAFQDTSLKLGAQNLSAYDEGAYTGEVSGAFLREWGVEYVIVGHSERREHFFESNEMVAEKIQAAFRQDLKPIVCVGETLALREAGKTMDFIKNQLKIALTGLGLGLAENLVIAYEPLWAIGTGKNATPEQAEEVLKEIRDYLKIFLDAPTALKIRLLYGGSVKTSNAALLLAQNHVEGLLVGGASLDPKAFYEILNA